MYEAIDQDVFFFVNLPFMNIDTLYTTSSHFLWKIFSAALVMYSIRFTPSWVKYLKHLVDSIYADYNLNKLHHFTDLFEF